VRVKAIEQPPPRRVGQRFEDLVDIHGPEYMQVNTCLSISRTGGRLTAKPVRYFSTGG
jgi:hypothetical protein